MALIPMTNTFSICPKGEQVFRIYKVEYNEEFGKLIVHLVNAQGNIVQNRFSLINQDGSPNEKACNAFSFFAGAPKQFIQYLEEDNRPQVQLDVDYENGMGVSVGRIREDKVYDFKFVGLSHNTVRGAAGGAVLCAELLKAQGYITKK